MAGIVKEPEDLAFVLLLPASVLDAAGQESTMSLGYSLTSPIFCFPDFDKLFKTPEPVLLHL